LQKTKTKKQTPFTQGWKFRTAQTSPAIVSVVWLDAAVDSGVCLDTSPGWQEGYKTFGAVMETTGFLLKSDKDWVVLGQERHAERDSGFRRVVHIPVYAVCSTAVLREAVRER
jgi:hypothetical protein